MSAYGLSCALVAFAVCVSCGQDSKEFSTRRSPPSTSMALPATPESSAPATWSGATAYTVDLGLVLDFEDMRQLIDNCLDLGELEHLRAALETALDLEALRPSLELRGRVHFRGCPHGVTGPGISDEPK